MAAHSSILAWRMLWMEEPGGLLSIGLHRVGHDWGNLACMHACIGKGNGNSLQYFCLENSRGRWAWWGAVYGVAQSWTQLQRLSSSIHTNVYQRLFKNLIFIYKYLFHITITHIMPWNYDILYCKMKNNFKAVHKLWTHFCKNVHIHITELVSVKMCVCMYKQFRVV